MEAILLFFYLIRVSTRFTRLKPADLVAFVRNVVILMTANPNFLLPVPALVDVTAAVDRLADFIQKSAMGDSTMISLRNEAQVSLLMMVRNLASYVQGNCQNTLSILIGSGFHALQSRSPVTQPTTPTNVRLSLGAMSGSLLVRFKKGRNSRNCSVQTATSAAGPFTDQPMTTKSSSQIEGLPVMATTWVRVRSNGAGGSSEWSSPISHAVI